MIKDKKVLITILIIIIATISIIYFINNKKYNYTSLLDNNSLDIIYNIIDNNQDKVPYININNSLIKEINQEIDSIYQNYLLYSPNGFSYNYNVSGNILSIIITAHVIQPEQTHYDIIYKSYNIDLNEMKQLSNKDVLNIYNITEEKMEFYLYHKFLNYYNELLKEKYFTKEQYDFETFLEEKNIDNLLDDNNYYINNNHLELYKYFNIYTDYNEDSFFNEDSFHFIVT